MMMKHKPYAPASKKCNPRAQPANHQPLAAPARYTHTHTETDRQTDRQTHTHTHTTQPYHPLILNLYHPLSKDDMG